MKERPILFRGAMVREVLADTKTHTRRIVKLPADTAGVVVDPGGTVFGPGPYVKAFRHDGEDPPMHPRIRCPYGYPGDRLWVRETWGLHAFGDETDWERASVAGCSEGEILSQYKLTHRADWGPLQDGCYWRPAIHMPRWASRLTLKVTAVRVERLQAITEADARAEGVKPYTPPHGHISPDQRVPGPGFDDARLGDQPHRLPFAHLWDEINGKPRPMLDGEGEPVLDDDGRPIMIAPHSWASNPWVWVVEFKRVRS